MPRQIECGLRTVDISGGHIMARAIENPRPAFQDIRTRLAAFDFGRQARRFKTGGKLGTDGYKPAFLPPESYTKDR